MTLSTKHPATAKTLSSKVQKAFESMKSMPRPQADELALESVSLQHTLQKKRRVAYEETLQTLLRPQTLRRIQAVLEQKQPQLGITDQSSLLETAITEWLDRNGY